MFFSARVRLSKVLNKTTKNDRKNLRASPPCGTQMGVSKNWGIPKMDGEKRETPIKMDDLGCFPLFLETSQIFLKG